MVLDGVQNRSEDRDRGSAVGDLMKQVRDRVSRERNGPDRDAHVGGLDAPWEWTSPSRFKRAESTAGPQVSSSSC